ncbi:TPA: hypothetical protein ACGPMP_002597 [Enterobacter roggenkampii]
MNLTKEEIFALTFTLRNKLDLLKIVLNEGCVIERSKTGVGFFSTIKLPQIFTLENNKDRYWERGFFHKKLPYGGCFMIAVEDDNCLEIEAVVYESEWPEPFVEEDFFSQ